MMHLGRDCIGGAFLRPELACTVFGVKLDEPGERRAVIGVGMGTTPALTSGERHGPVLRRVARWG